VRAARRASCNRSASAAQWSCAEKSEIRKSGNGNFLDELSTLGENTIAEFYQERGFTVSTLCPEQFPLQPATLADLLGGDKMANAKSSAAFWPATSAGRSATRFCSMPRGVVCRRENKIARGRLGLAAETIDGGKAKGKTCGTCGLISTRRVFCGFGGFASFAGFQRRVVQAEIVLRGFVALPRGADEPLHRLLRILFHAASGLVAQAEIALRIGAHSCSAAARYHLTASGNPAARPGRFRKKRRG
jgi:hypothetical protein